MKNVYYFSHDGNARNDEKILMLRTKYGWEGYGIYWVLVEIMFENKDTCLRYETITGLSHCYNIDITLLQNIIKTATEISLFTTDSNKFWSESLRRRKQVLLDLQEKHSKGGKKGMLSRWGKREKGVDTITSNNSLITIERKENKIKENKIKEKDLNTCQSKKQTDPRIKSIIDYFSEKHLQEIGTKPLIDGGKDGKAISRLLNVASEPTIKEYINAFFDDQDAFLVEKGKSFNIFYSIGFRKYQSQNGKNHKSGKQIIS